MDINTLVARIKQLHRDATMQKETTGDTIADAKIEGYLFGVNKVLKLIKEEKDIARMKQQLARKQERLQQGPDTGLTHLIGEEESTSAKGKKQATVTPFPAPANPTDEDVDDEKLAG